MHCRKGKTRAYLFVSNETSLETYDHHLLTTDIQSICALELFQQQVIVVDTYRYTRSAGYPIIILCTLLLVVYNIFVMNVRWERSEMRRLWFICEISTIYVEIRYEVWRCGLMLWVCQSAGDNKMNGEYRSDRLENRKPFYTCCCRRQRRYSSSKNSRPISRLIKGRSRLAFNQHRHSNSGTSIVLICKFLVYSFKKLKITKYLLLRSINL